MSATPVLGQDLGAASRAAVRPEVAVHQSFIEQIGGVARLDQAFLICIMRQKKEQLEKKSFHTATGRR
jgi:hypothetical protein